MMATPLQLALVAVLGLIAGAAVVHVAEAALAKRRIARPVCPYCTQPMAPLQWSATVALLTGQSRCAACGRRARIPRLLGELYLAVVWTLLVARFGAAPRALLAMATTIPLVMLLVTDLEAKLVPNRITLPALATMLVVGTLMGPALPFLGAVMWWQTAAGAALGFAVFRVLVWIGVALFGEGALGEGDITLSAYVGAVVGFPVILASLVLTFAFGGIGAALVLILGRGKLKTAIPYGPFIILGCTAMQIWGEEILLWFLT
jgi:prepilin signal peptidase PulO-like enzyme (type II secretory pathway)